MDLKKCKLTYSILFFSTDTSVFLLIPQPTLPFDMLQAIYNFIVGLARMLVNNPEPAYGLLTDQTHFKLYCLELAPDSITKII